MRYSEYQKKYKVNVGKNYYCKAKGCHKVVDVHAAGHWNKYHRKEFE